MRQVSRGRLGRLRCTPAGFTAATLDGDGLRGLSPTRPDATASLSGSCPSGRIFAIASFRRHLAVPPLRVACPSPPSGWAEDLHLPVTKHARHTKKRPSEALAPDGLYLLDSPQRGSAAASSPSRVVNSCLPVIYTLEKEVMQEIPAWPRYTGVLFCGHQPCDRRLCGHHPPRLPAPVVQGCVTGPAKERLVLRQHRFRERRYRYSASDRQNRARRRRLCRRYRLLHSHSLPSTRPDRRRISPPAASVAYSVVHYPIYTTATTVDAKAVSECIGKVRIRCVYSPVRCRVQFQAGESCSVGGRLHCGKRMTS